MSRDGRQQSLMGFHDVSAEWETCCFTIPSGEIALVTSILEAYDNQFVLRTDRAGAGDVRVWYHGSCRALLEQLLIELRTQFPLHQVRFLSGMVGLEDIYPDEA